jgi:hypothetical protein
MGSVLVAAMYEECCHVRIGAAELTALGVAKVQTAHDAGGYSGSKACIGAGVATDGQRREC